MQACETPRYRWLADQIGSFVRIDGQVWMLVALRGRWAIFENEDERTVQRTLEAAVALVEQGDHDPNAEPEDDPDAWSGGFADNH